MRIACVITTIHVPRVLALYAKYGPGVHFIVIGDRKTPDEDAVVFLQENVPNHAYYGIDAQYKLGYKCARLIPENCIQRRNIGFLEALRWGADLVVSIDDDNIPLNQLYFNDFRAGFPSWGSTDLTRWSGLLASSESGWFDVGSLLQPLSPHRGFPHDKASPPIFESVVDVQAAVSAGTCLGDPDIGAIDRISRGPTVHGLAEVLRHGVVTDPRQTWTVFNSQNTAVIRDMVPAWFMFPHVGRYDDIFASLVVQAVAREKGYHIHFGAPFVFQQRNQHNLINDLKSEMLGLEHVVHFAGILDHGVRFAADEHPARTVFKKFLEIDWFPKDAAVAALAWMDDVEKVL